MRIEDELLYPDPCVILKSQLHGRDVLEVWVEHENYQACRERSQHMWSNRKTGKYGKGLANTEIDPYKIVRQGLIAELAFSAVLLSYEVELPVNVREVPGGFPHDFLIGHKTVDIKTAGSNYGKNLIQAKTPKGHTMKLCDFNIASFIKSENIEQGKCLVVLVGWESKETVISRGLKEPYRDGGQKNFEMWHAHCSPIIPFMESAARCIHRLHNVVEKEEQEYSR